MSGPYVGHDHKCRGYAPQQRYIELWDRHGKEWFGTYPGMKMDVVRGWPARVSISLASFIGGECRFCDKGYVHSDMYHSPDLCRSCHGKYTAPGLAATLGGWPLERVVISDKAPNPIDGHFNWWPENGMNPASGVFTSLWTLPNELFQHGPLRGLFATRDAALSALSTACLRFARGEWGKENSPGSEWKRPPSRVHRRDDDHPPFANRETVTNTDRR
jgi:hypothetical protein